MCVLECPPIFMDPPPFVVRFSAANFRLHIYAYRVLIWSSCCLGCVIKFPLIVVISVEAAYLADVADEKFMKASSISPCLTLFCFRILPLPQFLWVTPYPYILPESALLNAPMCVHLTRWFSTRVVHVCTLVFTLSGWYPCLKAGGQIKKNFLQSQIIVPYWSNRRVFQWVLRRGTMFVSYLVFSSDLQALFACNGYIANQLVPRMSC